MLVIFYRKNIKIKFSIFSLVNRFRNCFKWKNRLNCSCNGEKLLWNGLMNTKNMSRKPSKSFSPSNIRNSRELWTRKPFVKRSSSLFAQELKLGYIRF